MSRISINRARRAQLKSMARYAAAGLVENAQVMFMGGFEDLPEHEIELIKAEFEAIGRRIYQGPDAAMRAQAGEGGEV